MIKPWLKRDSLVEHFCDFSSNKQNHKTSLRVTCVVRHMRP